MEEILPTLPCRVRLFIVWTPKPAWDTVSEDTHVSLTNMNGGSALNYLLLVSVALQYSYNILFVFLATTLICTASAVWLGEFHGTGQYMGAEVLNGLGTSAYQAVIQLTIFNMFFVHERGRMLAVYLFGQQLGSILGLISGGTIADGPGWRWSQYIVAIANAVVFLLLFFSFEETMFPRFLFSSTTPAQMEATAGTTSQTSKKADLENTCTAESPASTFSELPSSLFPKRTYLQTITLWVYQNEDSTTYWTYFKRPFFLWTFPTAVIPGFIFAFGCTAGIVSFNTISEILSSAPYNFSSTTVGLICFATLIGSTIGYFTGVASDHIVLFLTRRNKGVKEPEMRLWTLAASFVYAALGYMLYGWGAQTKASWVVVAIGLGAMIAQQVSACTVATAYAMECFPGLGGELVVILAMCSSMINFAISYSVQPFINAAGYGWAFFFFGMSVLASICGGVVLIIHGKNWRRKCASRYYRYISETITETLVS
ncbi:MFS transporter protein [Rutstroemia sp. NJR-2017a BBW]|nr:MFS transporter protein [Rutstroemia sp. NJR-2017a BBW]